MGTPAKICYVINAFEVGGAETVVFNLARKIDAAAFDVTVLAIMENSLDEDSEMFQRFKEEQIRTRRMAIRSFRNPMNLMKVFHFFKRNKFLIVHSHKRPSDGWATIIARWAGVPVRLWTRHLVYNDMSSRQLKRYKTESQTAAAVLAVSDSVKENCIEYEGIDSSKVRTVLNGIDTERFSPLSSGKREEIRGKLGLAPNELLFLFVGRMNNQKCPEAFLRLVWKMRSSGHLIRGFMCGIGPLEGAIIRMIEEDGTGGVVHLGLRRDIPELLAAADLFVSTSRNEGLPLNVMEAMSSGTPVVAPGIGQIACLVESHSVLEEGLLPPLPLQGEVNEDLLDVWMEKILALVNHPEKMSLMGKLGRRVIESEYSLGRMIQAHQQIYSEFLSLSR